ncbi:unnamed protein product [Strongylus vulgaris]|uniref:Uncharacterized protein n=1 Tax=Strongylus vulgaris TaxID=40348 RepID=A0A3P7IME8_STRVU|nr:unnamed protein product [Strongylus vulgaris]
MKKLKQEVVDTPPNDETKIMENGTEGGSCLSPMIDVTSCDSPPREDDSEENPSSQAANGVPSLHVEPRILDKFYLVQGRMLLKLFRFCPNCGNNLSTSDQSTVSFTAIGTAPIVQFICSNCSSSTAMTQRWDGHPVRDPS